MLAHEIVLTDINTPLGKLGAIITDRGVAVLTTSPRSVVWCNQWLKRWIPGARLASHSLVVEQLRAELDAYCAGKLRQFSVPLDLRGTDFQLGVWAALQKVGYGQVSTYSRIAQAVGRPSAVRAVGAANGANPVAIIVPCHRIIGSDGTLTGYAGGLDMKRRLLELEGSLLSVQN